MCLKKTCVNFDHHDLEYNSYNRYCNVILSFNLYYIFFIFCIVCLIQYKSICLQSNTNFFLFNCSWSHSIQIPEEEADKKISQNCSIRDAFFCRLMMMIRRSIVIVTTAWGYYLWYFVLFWNIVFLVKNFFIVYTRVFAWKVFFWYL